MNPADKFMTPRPPPPTPALLRLNTSTSVLTKIRADRSLSPGGEKLPWSPRMLFGLRPQAPASVEVDKRGRSSSLNKLSEGISHTSAYPGLIDRSDEMRKVRSVPHTRDVSPQSGKRSHSRDPSPLRRALDANAYNATTLTIPDEIAEEAEDDDNFANQLNRISLSEKFLSTPLAPPPSRVRSPAARVRTSSGTSKPLPQLPEETPLTPPPLHIRSVVSVAELPRSHFSTSTISTTFASPTDSHYSFSETQSISDTPDDEDFTADISSGDEFAYSPVFIDNPARCFSGYSLPDGDYSSEQTLRKEMPLSQLTSTVSRRTFGAAASNVFSPSPSGEVGEPSALEQFLNEMGYLGDVIIGK